MCVRSGQGRRRRRGRRRGHGGRDAAHGGGAAPVPARHDPRTARAQPLAQELGSVLHVI